MPLNKLVEEKVGKVPVKIESKEAKEEPKVLKKDTPKKEKKGKEEK